MFLQVLILPEYFHLHSQHMRPGQFEEPVSSISILCRETPSSDTRKAEKYILKSEDT